MTRGLSLVAAAVVTMLAADASAQDKKRIAILSFEDAAVRSSAAAAMRSTQDVGASLADVLVNELLKEGKYTIIERRALDEVLKEQNFSNSSRADAKTAANIGRVLGVDAIVIGSVTEFVVEESAVGVGSGPLNRITRGVVGGGKRVNARASVAMTARMVNTSTGEVLTSVSGSGDSAKGSVEASGGYATGIDMTSASFQGSALGEAINRAAQSVASGLSAFAAKLSAVRVDYTGLVADVTGNTLILNVGRLKGAQVGDTVEISRSGRTVLDPATKKVLRTFVDKIATARITEVDDSSATAMLSGAAPVQVGDQIRRVP
jgi:curli biogenesis system outer membrane secretion channel CsgG